MYMTLLVQVLLKKGVVNGERNNMLCERDAFFFIRIQCGGRETAGPYYSTAERGQGFSNFELYDHTPTAL